MDKHNRIKKNINILILVTSIAFKVAYASSVLGNTSSYILQQSKPNNTIVAQNKFNNKIEQIIRALKKSNVSIGVEISVGYNKKMVDTLKKFKLTYAQYLKDNFTIKQRNSFYINATSVLEQFYIQNIKNTFQVHLIRDLLQIIIELSIINKNIFFKTKLQNKPIALQKIIYDIFKNNIEIKNQENKILIAYINENLHATVNIISTHKYLLKYNNIVSLAIKYYPQTMATFLKNLSVQDLQKIKTYNNKLLNSFLQIAKHKEAENLLPFYIEIFEHKLNSTDIVQHSKSAYSYYKLLVQTRNKQVEKMIASGDTPMNFNLLFINLQLCADRYFITPINQLHDQPDHIRFEKIKNFNLLETYYLIVCGSELLYTSSFIYAYNHLINKLNKNKYIKLLHKVHFDKYKKFIKTIANYNYLESKSSKSFLHNLSEEDKKNLIGNFVCDINFSSSDFLTESSDVISSFNGIKDSVIINSIKQHINIMYDSFYHANEKDGEQAKYPLSSNSYLPKTKSLNRTGKLIFSIYKQIFNYHFNIESNDSTVNNIFKSLSVLPQKNLYFNQSNTIYAKVLFYGDVDAEISFNFFTYAFNKKNWRIRYFSDWVLIESTKGRKIKIFANRPKQNQSVSLTNSQINLSLYLQRNKIKPSVVMHRGHSYFLPYTINQLDPYNQLVILGSCGSNNEIGDISRICTKAQIISTRQIGTSVVNSKLFYTINEQLRQSKDLIWQNIWTMLNHTFSKSKRNKDIFNEYISPADNLASLFFKVYHFRISELY